MKPKDLYLLGTVFVSLDLLRLRFSHLNRIVLGLFRPVIRPKERDRPSGASFFLLSASLARRLFGTSAKPAIIISAVADPVAGMAGRLKGAQGKSLIGSLAAFGASWLTAKALKVSRPARVAAVATLAERLGPGDDNLRLPFSLALTIALNEGHLTPRRQNGKKKD
ncbi:hypothetical protein [Thermosulfuriphilus sp.]